MNRLRPIPIRPYSLPHRHALRNPPQRFAHTKAKPTATPPKRRRFRAVRIWYGLVFVGGLAGGFAVRDLVSPSPWPHPGTEEDGLYLQAAKKEIEDLEVVKYMRAQCPPRPLDPLAENSETPLATADAEQEAEKAEHKGWIELDIKHNIVEANTQDNYDWGLRTRTATFHSMAGIRGLGVQRAFLNTETKELVAVVWIGKSLSGWPGLAHGGAIATIFQDCMSRMVAGPDVPIDPDTIDEPTSLSMTYARKTRNHSFYIIRAAFTEPKTPQMESPPPKESASAKWSWLPSWKDLTKKTQPTEAKETVEITGTMENIYGDLLVRAKGTFPVAK
ncbi:hypothetical protein P280DRAFT_403203 [Massarina eburnea CBS 473.64]|uniref:Thioesterase domain-containing protein n=1 Tax=Massarina eburnea CBS 473.64 TaxID=1395130 RepID=A0A6A6RWG2_9PLEO|nr:hypothetical protein P280DRAFT_403203 [Massarina eburnea CBS 473.64]